MSFKSTKEIYQVLIEGQTVQDTYKNTVHLDAITGNQVVINEAGKICKDVAYKFDNPSEWSLYERRLHVSVSKFRTAFFTIVGPNYKREIFDALISDLNDQGFIK